MKTSALTGLLLLGIVLILAVVVPVIIPFGYDEVLSVNGVTNDGAVNLPPFAYSQLEQQSLSEGTFCFPHIFGTDAQGHDYIKHVTCSILTTLVTGFACCLLAFLLGLLFRLHFLRSPFVLSLAMLVGIVIESSLGFAGLGIKVPAPSLGTLIRTTADSFQNYPFELVIPAIFLFVIAASLVLVCVGLAGSKTGKND